ncbi:MAG: 3-oxoisoapionate decarboxylase [Abditibacteriota bacterium]|nr:3-oxoisoapionate decarboxylase [Abditibacteriota bacterium]
MPTRLPFALNSYGLPHSIGLLATRGGERHPAPLDLWALMDAARDLNLAGLEAELTPEQVRKPHTVRDALQARELRFVPDYMVILNSEASDFRAFLDAGAAIGATVVRVTLSSILCGDRRALSGGWDAYLEAVAARLKEVLPHAEALGLCIAVENHQDATSDDLLRLHEMSGHSPAYGITFDTGNPLAVGEGVLEFTIRIAPLIRHLHLKDYTIHFAPEGFRLVRCAAGDGVIDFPAILDIVRANGHDVLPGIEIAAQPTRTIPILEESWWACYPLTPSTRLIAALKVLWERGRPAHEPYSSAWERGADSTAVSAEEWDIMQRSVQYFRGLTEKSKGSGHA